MSIIDEDEAKATLRRAAPNGLRHYQRVMIKAGCGVNALSGYIAISLPMLRDLPLTLIFRIRLEITGVMAFMQLLVQRSVVRLTIRPRFTAGRSPTSFAQRCTCL